MTYKEYLVKTFRDLDPTDKKRYTSKELIKLLDRGSQFYLGKEEFKYYRPKYKK